VIEFARNVCGVTDATSTEFEKPGTPCIEYLPDQTDTTAKGGTLRLGTQEATILEGSLIHKLYGSTIISDRHRHRYEVSPDKHDLLRSKGLVLSGTSHNGRLVEYIENPACTYFVATQAHPEFKSRPGKPHPMFDGLVKACISSSHC
jgi:CTP synthase